MGRSGRVTQDRREVRKEGRGRSELWGKVGDGVGLGVVLNKL